MKTPAAWNESPKPKRQPLTAEASVELSQDLTFMNKVLGGSEQLKARIDMGPEVAGKGLCPECKTPMVRGEVGGNPGLICVKDRIALPLPDESQTVSEEPK